MNIQLLIAPTNYNVSNNVDTISVDTSSGGITNIYLQKISPATPRRTIFVVDISGNASVGNIKIYTFAGDSINFQSSISLDVDGIIAEIVEADGDAYICNLSTDDSAPSTNGHIIQDNGTPLPQRQNLNFIGGNVTDDALNNATKVQFNADKNYVPTDPAKTQQQKDFENYYNGIYVETYNWGAAEWNAFGNWVRGK